MIVLVAFLVVFFTCFPCIICCVYSISMQLVLENELPFFCIFYCGSLCFRNYLKMNCLSCIFHMTSFLVFLLWFTMLYKVIDNIESIFFFPILTVRFFFIINPCLLPRFIYFLFACLQNGGKRLYSRHKGQFFRTKCMRDVSWDSRVHWFW